MGICMRSIFIIAILTSSCGIGYAANKCMIDGKVTYQDLPCPTNSVASKVETHNMPIDRANESFEQRVERLTRPTENRKLPPTPPFIFPKIPVAEPFGTPQPAQKSIQEKIADKMKKSDEKLAAAKVACGGNLPTEPSIGMTEKNFHNCTVVGVLVTPDSVNVTETAAGVTKQFVYSNSSVAAGFRFLYTRNGVITAIQR